MIYLIVMTTQDTLQAAKRTFLTSTETKSPLKRPITPEPDLEEEVNSANILSFSFNVSYFFRFQARLVWKKLELLPPLRTRRPRCASSKQATLDISWLQVSWKTRWQSTVGGGAAAVRGKRGGRSEADKLLGDEGVIQMLHRLTQICYLLTLPEKFPLQGSFSPWNNAQVSLQFELQGSKSSQCCF